jgi:N-acyl-D-amino-acid deacylase
VTPDSPDSPGTLCVRDTLDVLIRGGTVFDGRGSAGRPLDVALAGGRIAAIDTRDALAAATAGVVIDAAGKYVCPGFIDIHTHSDRNVLANARMESKLRQGVTTEVGGNCGSGVAPALGAAAGDARDARDARDASESAAGAEGRTWPTLAAYFDAIETAGIAGNYATWAAHGTLRASTVGYAMRPPTDDELETMRHLLRESLEAGAFGLSTGLIYAPSGYADTDEIAALASVARAYDGLYASHIRGEAATLLDALAEAIEIGRRAGVPVQVAHHKASGRPNWGRVEQSLALMDAARAGGVDVACDQYPYVASSTGLSSILPKWALEGGRPQLMARLSDPDARARIAEETRERRYVETLEARREWGAPMDGAGWRAILVVRCAGDREAEGRLLGDVAEERGVAPLDLALDLLARSRGVVPCVFFSMCETDVRTVMRWPHTMVGSDASCVAPYGSLSKGKPHPRAYGTFARVLGRYVREEGVLTWPEAIHKMTGMPAARLGLAHRGRLEPGAWADVVVFDPRRVADRATFQGPHQYAAGIEHVLVNGVPVVRDGEHTGALPGRVLRRGADN